MTEADKIRKELKLKRKQVSNISCFVKNPLKDKLFQDIKELNAKLSLAIEGGKDE